MMNAERWQRVKELFQLAIVRQPAERASFLAASCNDDETLREQVQSLLRSHEKSRDFIEAPAFAVAPEFLRDDPEALVGQSLGRFRIESVLGIGGMGVVYLACDEGLGRKVGLKLLPQALVADAAQLERLKREARTASALNHPNIVTIHEIGQVDSTHYIATEFIEGTTLRERIARGAIPPNEALDVAIQIASALSVAHAAGIVHRDIKPENIMLRPDGYVKVLDFGIAKFTQQSVLAETTSAGLQVTTQPGMILGTTRYMSPEQARGQAVDARSDVWSLGVVLYEMLAGGPPFEGETPTDVLAAVLLNQAAPLEQRGTIVPLAVQTLVEKSLRKDPAERYATADAMLCDLRASREHSASTTAWPIIQSIKRRKKTIVLAAASLSLVASGIVYLTYFARHEIKSVAVLPFQHTAGDGEAEYLADGITESLINSLATLPRLRVMARSTTFTYKGKTMDPRDVGHELKVDCVVTGRITRRENKLGLQAELVKTSDASQLWGAQYNRRPADLPDLQSQLSQDVSEKLRVKLTVEEQRRVTKQYTVDTEAYRDYLKGRFLQEKRTQKDLRESLDYFNRAIERDPTYALAYAGLADTYRLFANYDVVPPIDACPKAKAAALKALEIDNTLAEAHTTLGMLLLDYDWDLPAAEKAFKEALRLNPNYSTAHHWYGNAYLLVARRFDEAIAAMKRAQELDPLSPIISTNLGDTYAAAGRLDEAVEQLRKTLVMHPKFANAYFDLGRAYLRRGEFAQALAQFETGKNIAPSETNFTVMTGVAHAFSGNRPAAMAVLEELKQICAQHYCPPYYVAIIHAGLGQKEEAFSLLERAYHDRALEMNLLEHETLFSALRSDPRFAELVSRVRDDGSSGR